jgi:hypothetical protein
MTLRNNSKINSRMTRKCLSQFYSKIKKNKIKQKKKNQLFKNPNKFTDTFLSMTVNNLKSYKKVNKKKNIKF